MQEAAQKLNKEAIQMEVEPETLRDSDASVGRKRRSSVKNDRDSVKATKVKTSNRVLEKAVSTKMKKTKLDFNV